MTAKCTIGKQFIEKTQNLLNFAKIFYVHNVKNIARKFFIVKEKS